MNPDLKFISGKQNLKLLLTCIGIFFITVSCQKDEVLEVSPTGNEENQYVNSWILQEMNDAYLWNTEIPQDVDKNLEPEAFFTELLSGEDRFSWIQPNYQELLNSLKGVNMEAGFEFVLYKESSGSDNVIAQILYIKPASPAEAAGLKRGDIITKINDQTLTVSNYKELIKDFKKNHTIVYKPLMVDENQFGPEATASLAVVEYAENPNYLFKVFEEGGHKVGYYVYNFFASGPDSDDGKYDQEMDDIFSIFKSEGITDLVLDLRFNSGGSEVAAKNLASLIGQGVDETKLFFSRAYNDNLMTQIANDPALGDGYLKSFFLNKASNVGNQLALNRVYILTSSRTASASELIINGLEPYMDVYLIGDVTYGKNVGSISIYKEADPKNTYGLQPIVVKVANSEGFSEYGDGFLPDVDNKDNSLYLYPLGDLRENLLASAIKHITGAPEPGRVEAAATDREILAHSLDEKRRSFILNMDEVRK